MAFVLVLQYFLALCSRPEKLAVGGLVVAGVMRRDFEGGDESKSAMVM
jgi:hypothetical protein